MTDDLGTCPMCGAAITGQEENPRAREPYVPRVMWICAEGHRVVNPSHHGAPRS